MAKSKKIYGDFDHVIRSSIKKFIGSIQKIKVNNEDVELQGFKLRQDALNEMLKRLNGMIEEQLINLKLEMPRYSSGEKQDKIIGKTITLKIVNPSNFPNLKKPSAQNFRDSILSLLSN
jgi:hypothetical protein